MQRPSVVAAKFCHVSTFVYIIYFGFSFYCACVSSKHTLMYLNIRSETKNEVLHYFKIKVAPAPRPRRANNLYHRLILSIYTIYVSGKLDQGGGGGGEGGARAIFSKPKKMRGQNPV